MYKRQRDKISFSLIITNKTKREILQMKIVLTLLIISVSMSQQASITSHERLQKAQQVSILSHTRLKKAQFDLKWENVLRLLRVEKSLMMILKQFFLRNPQVVLRGPEHQPIIITKDKEVDEYFNIIYDPVEPVYRHTAYKEFNDFKEKVSRFVSPSGKRLI